MTWSRTTLFSLDTETTGVSVHHDRIVTATIAKIVNGECVATREWLIAPGVEIPEQATAVHGITTEHARDNGRPPAEALAEIGSTVRDILIGRFPLVVFNACFDLSILEAELARHGIGTIDSQLDATHWHTLIDPMVLGRGIDTVNKVFQKGRRYRLPDLCGRYGVPFEESHDATADAVGAALLAIAILDAEPYFDGHGPERLYTAQKTWRSADQKRFRDWVVKNGLTDQYGDIDGGWPLHTQLHQGVLA